MKIDVSDIEGTRCYCSEDSKEQIRDLIKSLDSSAVHILGSGDYHYLSLFLQERIKEDYSLILIDNHPDDQQGAFAEMLSCGSWVRDVRQLPHCLAVQWIDGEAQTHGMIPEGSPVYISLDLDVLDSKYILTNWNQGQLSPIQLKEKIAEIAHIHPIIAADVCGEADGIDRESRQQSDDLNTEMAAMLQCLLRSNP